MKGLRSWLASPPADAAIEIASDSVGIAVGAVEGGRLVLQRAAAEPLPRGAVVPAVAAPNVVDHAAVVRALRAACDRIGVRPRRVALVVPDPSARVSLVRFERVPPRPDDLDQLIRWQLKKAAPFPIDEACVTYSPGAPVGQGREFIVAMARRDVVRGYEAVCEEIGAQAGLVDLATFSILNLHLDGGAPAGDWLLMSLQPDYASMAIMRGDDVIFFRTRGAASDDPVADFVHQTTMYYQDRLAGEGFQRVWLGGAGASPADFEAARRALEERVGAVEPFDLHRSGVHVDAGAAAASSGAAALAGVLRRVHREVMAA